jgi:hypothetical protein
MVEMTPDILALARLFARLSPVDATHLHMANLSIDFVGLETVS